MIIGMGHIETLCDGLFYTRSRERDLVNKLKIIVVSTIARDR